MVLSTGVGQINLIETEYIHPYSQHLPRTEMAMVLRLFFQQ